MPLEELFKRTRNASLNLIIKRPTLSDIDVRALIMPQFFSVAGRVKTLYLDLYSSENPHVSDLISSFPALENIFFDSSSPTNVNLLPTHIQNQVKIMQIVVEHLGNLTIPGHFRELTWLSLKYELNSVPPLLVLEALDNLPNLRFLRLFWSSWRSPSETRERIENSRSIVILPKLTVLISNSPVLHLIHAPKLLYLDITPQHSYPVHSSNKDTYYRLCGFDLSRITHIYCGMDVIHGSSPPHTTWGLTDRRYKSHMAYQVLFRKYRIHNSLQWILDDFPASDLNYPNEFYLPSRARGSLEQPDGTLLISCIKKATNLVEIVLDDIYSTFSDRFEIESISMALRGATTVRNLIVLSHLPLKTLCDLLSDEDLLPNLERLSYTAVCYRDGNESSSYILNSLQKLKKRHGIRTKGLEIELKGFLSIQSEELEEIEKLGFLRLEGNAENCFNFFISTIGSSMRE
ncbi:hypothetical protein Clacol_010439 [Clathrus columnatus]|uniref:F-box domain-containing protein n=1 Tax=Clathrus columnatus TaxID=1419009 RepID=A0AAV5ASN0_9AGAM|nr:hypothetical protein Clacol_010439 [Clathrus columnatus]